MALALIRSSKGFSLMNHRDCSAMAQQKIAQRRKNSRTNKAAAFINDLSQARIFCKQLTLPIKDS